ncbi:LysR family transcriptional regulator [Shewanella sp. NKUCC05_KAH]|jgi:DNA-binding transcriptional LysR family regulator|uniref:LysR family transcriptional regulator n=1 Tax=Shewanella TaxID=22 RepID=UPI000E99D1A1|nr:MULTISPECIES: LysR family transcriptional regulator [unclassified Shewanella]MBS0042982.1 LysR family transcriptional regulator [Shewanella sp. M16]MBW3528874.1 LysR family transcriptional regulator [Shewanella sp. NKUCC05_KAH]MBW3530591.1 LysR family transcriptional regulator [Shewanella sp. NKUCC06_TVS]MCU8041239.1 LysR family transcriptional regulator [Shewanella sp. SM69]MCU8058026.1 LysR family transcriptional regulator [Shewanella sp. SM35]
MVDLRLLRFFIAIFEENNITSAANRCFVSQPSLSAGLKQLEEELGGQLFERSKKGVKPLDSAHYLYPLAVKLVEEASKLPGLFMAKASRQKLRLAVMPDLSQRRLAGFLQQVNQAIDKLDLELVDYQSPADCRLSIDSLRHEDEVFFPLWEEDYVLCVPKDHTLAQVDSLRPEQLNGFDFIECPPCEAHQQTIGLLACSNMSLNLVAKAESKSLVMSLVLAGFGVSFLPDGLIEDEPRLKQVKFDGPRMFRRIGLCYPSHQAVAPTLATLLRHLAARSN